MSRRKQEYIKARKRTVVKRRLAVIAFSLILVAGCVGFFGGMMASAHDTLNRNSTVSEMAETYYKSVLIHAGDSLWSIAEEYMSDEYDSIESYVAELKRINSLKTDNIQANQHILVVYTE